MLRLGDSYIIKNIEALLESVELTRRLAEIVTDMYP
jgi:hypothetical protein